MPLEVSDHRPSHMLTRNITHINWHPILNTISTAFWLIPCLYYYYKTWPDTFIAMTALYQFVRVVENSAGLPLSGWIFFRKLQKYICILIISQNWNTIGSWNPCQWKTRTHFDGLVQERCNSIANALELHLSCTYPLIYQAQSRPSQVHHQPWFDKYYLGIFWVQH